jgi:hypothetical protein
MGVDGRIRPGEVRNPEGRNQYTYRREIEQNALDLLDGELPPDQLEDLPQWVQKAIKAGMTRGEAIVAIMIAGALRGERPYFQEALKRVWPVEPTDSGANEQPVPWWDDLPDISDLCDEAREKLREAAHIELIRGRARSRRGATMTTSEMHPAAIEVELTWTGRGRT